MGHPSSGVHGRSTTWKPSPGPSPSRRLSSLWPPWRSQLATRATPAANRNAKAPVLIIETGAFFRVLRSEESRLERIEADATEVQRSLVERLLRVISALLSGVLLFYVLPNPLADLVGRCLS